MGSHMLNQEKRFKIMSGKKSKDKGKSFEREVCKFLSERYSGSFQRVFDSGAFTGGSNQIRRQTLSEGQIRNQKGDIIPPDGWKYFNCECKSYSDFPFHQLFFKMRIVLLESWIQQLMNASDTGDCNIIIMKFNRKGKYVMINKNEPFCYNKYVEYVDENQNCWVFMEFENFFNLNHHLFSKRCQNMKIRQLPLG